MIPLFGRSRIMDHDETLAVLREGTIVGTDVQYADGYPVKQVLPIFAVFCNVQPMSGRDLLLVPEGDRLSENLWLWVPEQDNTVLVRDKVQRLDAVYQVQSAEDWGSYTRARMVRIDVGPDITAMFATWSGVGQ